MTPPSTPPQTAGRYVRTTLRTGLALHCADVLHPDSLSTQFLLDEACIKVFLKLGGNVRIEIGARHLPLGSEREGSCGAIVAVQRPEWLRRHALAGTRQRMVVLTLLPHWLHDAGLSPDALHEHLAAQLWQPSRRALALAEQLLHPVGHDGPVQRLQQESRVLELVSEAFGHLVPSGDAAPSSLLPASARQRVRRLQALLDSGEADTLGMAGIARRMGSNVSTLQQQFRAVSGQTIAHYLREHRLQRAAHALQHQGASVAQAAEIAGYSSQANFSTAFRRRYGVPPKHYRNRL
jgi:AraC-like DNA-binding protein